jgi:hypothetical protein
MVKDALGFSVTMGLSQVKGFPACFLWEAAHELIYRKLGRRGEGTIKREENS